jgi:predicted permease
MVLDLMESLRQDVRYAIRSIRRTPAFSATVFLIIALSIGATTAIFGLIDRVLLRRLPVSEPERLVEFLSRYPGEPHMNGFSWKVYEHFRDQNHVFSAVTGVSPARLQVGRGTGEAETIDGEYVPGDFFSVLGLQPAAGRLIEPGDARSDSAPVAVVSWSYWKQHLSGDRATGSQIVVNGVPTTVIGVTPRAFVGLRTMRGTPAVWLPATRPVALGLIARLKPGVTIEQARAEMQVLHRFRIEELASTSRDPRWLQAQLDVESAATGLSVLRDRFGTPLQVLMAGATLLLLIACTNVASMLLARGAARRREMAVRMSLGAGRVRLVRQVMMESLLLAFAGSLAGIVISYVAADALVRLMVSGRAPVGWSPQAGVETIPDARVLLFCAAMAIVTGVLSGLAPAWSAFRSKPIVSLRETGTTGDRPAARVFARGLVAAQICLSMVLLTGGWLFHGHLANLRSHDLGFDRDDILLFTLNPQGSGYDRRQLSQLYQDLLGRLNAMPGVRSATLSAVTPIEGGQASRFARVEGVDEKDQDRRRLSLNWVGPRYFETFGTPLLAGRDFTFDDAQRPRAAIVNQAMARHYFGAASPIGRRLVFQDDPAPYEIVGLVADAKYADLHEPAPRIVYLSAFQDGRIASHFALRTEVSPSTLAPDVRRLLQASAVKTIRLASMTTLADQMDASIVLERVMATLSGVSGALGAMLAAIGFYGLLAYSVTRRIPEIGVRMALGATERDVIRMILGDAAVLVGAGLLAGLPVAFWGRRVAASLVENLPQAATPLFAAAATMVVVALLAAYLPARRAARVRPIDALRQL